MNLVRFGQVHSQSIINMTSNLYATISSCTEAFLQDDLEGKKRISTSEKGINLQGRIKNIRKKEKRIMMHISDLPLLLCLH